MRRATFLTGEPPARPLPFFFFLFFSCPCGIFSLPPLLLAPTFPVSRKPASFPFKPRRAAEQITRPLRRSASHRGGGLLLYRSEVTSKGRALPLGGSLPRRKNNGTHGAITLPYPTAPCPKASCQGRACGGGWRWVMPPAASGSFRPASLGGSGVAD